jgi:hypothetical protein
MMGKLYAGQDFFDVPESGGKKMLDWDLTAEAVNVTWISSWGTIHSTSTGDRQEGCRALFGVKINLLSEVADDGACGVYGHHVRFHENEWKVRSGKASVFPRPLPYPT